jgi:hypothetical protein
VGLILFFPHGNNVERSFIFSQPHNGLYPAIIKSPDGYRAEVQSGRLKTEVLGGVTGFQMGVGDAPVAVFGGCPLIDSGNDNIYGSLFDWKLPQSRVGKVFPYFPIVYFDQFMSVRTVFIYAGTEFFDFSRRQINFQRI